MTPPPRPPKKYSQNLDTQNILIFLKTPKDIIIQNFEPPKNNQSLRMYENIRVTPLDTQNILIFLKTPKDIIIQNFEPPKITKAYVCMKISE